jgi:hypothetical protein
VASSLPNCRSKTGCPFQRHGRRGGALNARAGQRRRCAWWCRTGLKRLEPSSLAAGHEYWKIRDQRPVHEAKRLRWKFQKIVPQRPGDISLTRGNVGTIFRAGRCAETRPGWLTRQSCANPSQQSIPWYQGKMQGNLTIWDLKGENGPNLMRKFNGLVPNSLLDVTRNF